MILARFMVLRDADAFNNDIPEWSRTNTQHNCPWQSTSRWSQEGHPSQVEVTIDGDTPAAAISDEGDTDDVVLTEESSNEDSLESSLEI